MTYESDVDPDEALADEFEVGCVDMEQLLGESDVVSLHVPGGNAPHHLLIEEEPVVRGEAELLHALGEGRPRNLVP